MQEYKCVLCPVEVTEYDFVEPPKVTAPGKKRTEKEKEKERNEREAAQKAADFYRKKQEEMNRPVNPREPLKRTADNNWVHVTCAVWTPEVRFGSAKALSPSEGIPSIPRARYEEVCKVCKTKDGSCVSCHQCKAPIHVGCAHQSGHLLGFEVTPVKSSRRDQFNVVSINGETGVMSALVWCKEHIPTRTVVHRMSDIVNPPESQGKDSSAALPNALQFYIQNFKQADLALTGTVRKANLIAMATKTPAVALPPGTNRRASTTTTSTNGPNPQRASSIENQIDPSLLIPQSGDKVCITCGIDVSPKWWSIEKKQEKALINGHYGNLGSEAQKFVDQRNFQCHKCRKEGKEPVAHVSPPPAPPPPTQQQQQQQQQRQPPPPPAVESMPQLEPIRPPPTLTNLTSPPPPPPASEPRPSHAQYPWASSNPSASAPPPVAAPPIQAPLAGPPSSLPLSAPHTGPSPMAAPVQQPPATHHYPPSSTPYSDWHRSATQRSPPGHQMNGVPGGPNPLHPNHLRDLRPPPIAPISHHQAPSLQHGALGQPMVNGIPPSPPRRGPPVQNAPTPYLPSYHHQTPHSLHNLTNGGPPPRAGEHSFSQGLLTQRSPFSTPHGSPPITREPQGIVREPQGIVREPQGIVREPQGIVREPNLPNPSSRPGDARPASGASASPSLRNLLS
jgi:hypothetical protein